jgi:serine/threonine protein kinase
MVMDHDPGGALLRHRRGLPPPLTAALGLQLIAALDAVHTAGIVHCNVKPANRSARAADRPAAGQGPLPTT